MAEAEALEELVTAGQAALQIAEGQMGHDFGDERTFFNLLAASKFRPWLRKFTENGQDVVRKFEWYPDALNGRGNGSWVIASPNDLIDGEYFSDGDAFYKANGVPDHQQDAFCRAVFQKEAA